MTFHGLHIHFLPLIYLKTYLKITDQVIDFVYINDPFLKTRLMDSEERAQAVMVVFATHAVNI